MSTSAPRPARVLAHVAAAVVLTLVAVPTQAQALLHELVSPNEQPNGHFGRSVSGVPDVNGDGVSDFLVGARSEEAGMSPLNAGRAYLYSGADGSLLHELASPNEEYGGFFGWSVAGMPDVDGDGRGDLLIGAKDEDGGAPIAGRAYLFSGVSGVLLHELVSPNEEIEGFFGTSVSGVPDVDGDGVTDLLVGAPNESPGMSPGYAGQAYVFSGASGRLIHTLASPDEEFEGFFGYSVAGVPDVDDDGRGDLLVGAYLEDPGTSPFNAGRGYLFSGATGDLLRTLNSPNEEYNGHFGFSVAGVPDVDGDARGDLLIGAEHEDPGTSPEYAGRVYVFSGTNGALLYELASPNEDRFGRLGWSVAGVPDVDADGVSDLLVGAFGEGDDGGRAYAFSGESGALLLTLVSPYEGDDYIGFGSSVSGVSDVNGDGRGDLLVGAYSDDPNAPVFEGAGRAYVFSGAPSLALSAVTLNSPVPRGERLRFEVTITNHTPDPLSGDLTLDVTGPDGATYARLLEDDRTLGAGATRTPEYGLRVYDDAALGVYTATMTALEGGVTNLGEATFTFEVVSATRVAGGDESIAGRGTFGEVEVLEDGGFRGGTTAAVETRASGAASVVVGPNPATGSATVTLALAAPSAVRLALHDVLGREVAVVEAGALAAGSHRLALDVSVVPAGVYVWRLATGARIETGRLTVAR